MNTVGLIATYFVVWWTILLAILPWGIRTQDEEGEVTLGTERSAPVRPMLVRKAIATTIVAGIIVFALWLGVTKYGFDFQWLVDLGAPKGAAPGQ